MTTLTCPKCRHAMPENALDAGQCPACGFPLDGPVVLDGTATRRSPSLLIAVACVLITATGVAGYAFFGQTETPPPRGPDFAEATPTEPPVTHIAPFPHTPKPRDNQNTTPTPNPAPDANPTPKAPGGTPVAPAPVPVPAPMPVVVVVPPKKDGPRPIGVVMKIDPKIAPKRHFDQPDDTAALPDLNTGDRVTLTGKLRALKIGSVNGKGVIDATGLAVEEVVITGDLNGEAVVMLNSPGGKVTIGGYVGGNSKLTITAPGGEVVVLATSGRLTGGSTITVTAKRLDVAGKMLGGTKLSATLTTGGTLRLASLDEGALVTYRKAVATDPPIYAEKGPVRGGAKVVAE